MDRIERTDKLREAQDLIAQAVELIREATDDTAAEGRARAYIIGHLENWMYSESQIGSIPDLIEDMNESENEDDDEEDE